MNSHRLLCAALAGALVLASCGRQQDYPVMVSEADEPMLKGAFEPTWESLDAYETPQWFADAKLGIWAHWGPQCVEGTGDWMGRIMYMQGSTQYNYHVEHYGHPSEFGFKDLLPLFRGENWDPQALVAFYKEIGAKYFFAMGNHHDNFDLWDSQYQPWNSVNMGPKRDVLAEWEKAARDNGLPFGVSLHSDHAWTWFETAQRHDTTGVYKDVPYDGKLTKADGEGKWWEGYDPQDLYAQDHPMSENSWQDWELGAQWAWENGAALPSEEFVTNFYNRTLDVIRRYKPDVLYFDTTVLPFWPVSDAGLKIAAHYYNTSMAANNGNVEVVMTGKILSEEQRDALVWDVEKGAPNMILPEPWQTCTCLGNWHYNQDYYDYDLYKSASTVVKLLMDVVSKNGNLLLSVPLRADGTFDEKEEAILREFGAWMKTNSEAVYATRPWKVFGEGPIAESDVELKDQGFNEGSYAEATSDEIRFTSKDGMLYVTAMGWPADRCVRVKSLAAGSELYPEEIGSVELLGYGPVKFERTDDALVVTLPAKPLNDIAPVLKVR